MKKVKLNKQQAQKLGLQSAKAVVGRAPRTLVRGKVYSKRGESQASQAWARGEYR